MAKLPTFAKSTTLDKVELAVDVSILRYPCYVYIKEKNALAFIDEDGSVNLLEGAPILWSEVGEEGEDNASYN